MATLLRGVDRERPLQLAATHVRRDLRLEPAEVARVLRDKGPTRGEVGRALDPLAAAIGEHVEAVGRDVALTEVLVERAREAPLVARQRSEVASQERVRPIRFNSTVKGVPKLRF